EGNSGAAVVDEGPVDRALLQLLDLLGGQHADWRPTERCYELADRRGSEPEPQAPHVVYRADRLLRRVDVARLVGDPRHAFAPLVFGFEIVRPRLGVVQPLGTDLGAAAEVGQLD